MAKLQELASVGGEDSSGQTSPPDLTLNKKKLDRAFANQNWIDTWPKLGMSSTMVLVAIKPW